MPSQAYFDLLEACGKPGCPICRIVREGTRHYLEILFYESVNDVGMRAQLRAGRGFCSEHAWWSTEPGVGDALGVAIIYHDVLGAVLRELPAPPAAGRSTFATLFGQTPRQLSTAIKAAVAALLPRAPCPACQQRDKLTQGAVAVLLENLQNDELSTALAGSAGLCFPHLRLALEQIHDEQGFKSLLSLHREKMNALRDELAELIRKNDYRYREEEFGSERDAWQRAVAQVAGSRPWGAE